MVAHMLASVTSEEQMCPEGDYESENGICCNKCPPGTLCPATHRPHIGKCLLPTVKATVAQLYFYLYRYFTLQKKMKQTL